MAFWKLTGESVSFVLLLVSWHERDWVSQDTQQSCLLVQGAVPHSVSFVQLTNTGNITKEAVAKHEELTLHFKYLKLL